MASFKLDEGFSEAEGFMDAHGDDESATSPAIAKSVVEEWIMAQDETARKDIAFEILRTLRSSSITSIVEQISALLHLDPVERLPAEITSEIFTHLEAPVLLTASLVSKAWRERILDSQLWRRHYLAEGWGVDPAAMQDFEKMADQPSIESSAPTNPLTIHQRDSAIDVAEPKQKRRAPSSWLDDRNRNIQLSPMPMDNTSTWNEQHGRIEVDTGSQDSAAQSADDDQVMQDVSSPLKSEYQPNLGAVTRSNKRSSRDVEITDAGNSASSSNQSSMGQPRPLNLNLFPPLKPSLTFMTPSGRRLNWLYIYKQRRRLEENWSHGHYINYQLPQVGFEHEGHRECVYTIQFYGKWMVSGSRDNTMRIWNLETRRLSGGPLVGHTQSVLCLQFDPTPEEDVIISGSSDTTVRIWKFSTGQPLQVLRAHKESVLNLRFDHRYLVTCSKDKLIKVWNRRELDPLSPDYPKVNQRSNAQMPSYIIDTSHYTPLVLEQKITNRTIRTLAPYSLLMQLEGHGAAVNAIQIEGDRIVSASGDRNIKIWDVRDGRLLHTLMGHHKGIACVQFDSKRIVSGSSDNSIRIFDQSTGAEVACLTGHDNLVRTVQAGFGDAPGNEEELKQQAMTADRLWREAIENGDITRADLQYSRRSRFRNAGSNDPRSIMTIGANLPPGGGGTRWGKIVSGSYDEHIIIWRKHPDGRWIPAHRLSHADASHIATAVGTAAQARAAAQPNDQLEDASSLHALIASSGPPSAPASLGAGAALATAATATAMAPASPNLPLQGQNPGAQQALHQLQRHAQMMTQALSAQQGNQTFPGQARNANPPAHALPAGVGAIPPPVAAPRPGGHPHAHGHGHGHGVIQSGPHRVFKLQFDARKIVCCSQDPRIVVWDFANGDKDIEECSRFFIGP